MPSHTETVSLTGLPNEVLIQIVKCLCQPGTFDGQRATGDICLNIARGKGAVEVHISTHQNWETIEGDLSLSPLVDQLSAVARTCRGLHKTANTVLGDLAKARGIPKDVVDGWPSTAIRIWGTRKDLRRRLAATQSLLEMGLCTSDWSPASKLRLDRFASAKMHIPTCVRYWFRMLSSLL